MINDVKVTSINDKWMVRALGKRPRASESRTVFLGVILIYNAIVSLIYQFEENSVNHNKTDVIHVLADHRFCSNFNQKTVESQKLMFEMHKLITPGDEKNIPDNKVC